MLALSAGAVAATVHWMAMPGFSTEGYLFHQAFLALVSLYLWSAAYLFFHRRLTFAPAMWRPLFAPVWSVLWLAFSAPFFFGIFLLGPDFADHVLSWAQTAQRFTWVAALTHVILLLGERASEASRLAEGMPPPLPSGDSATPSPEVSLLAGLLLAFPALMVGLVSVVVLQNSFWVVGGDGGGRLLTFIFYALPALFGAVPYLAAYFLFWRVSPQRRPLWAPLWGLGWFLLTPLTILLTYAAYAGLLFLVMAYAFTCLTALTHWLLMRGWALVLRRRAA